MKLVRLKPLVLFFVCAAVLFAASGRNAQATIITVESGTTYEWLEFSQTSNMTVLEIEALLADPTSAIYGYRYASRRETAQLLTSFISYTGQQGYSAQAAPGSSLFLDIFGAMYDQATSITMIDVNGIPIEATSYRYTSFFYGDGSENRDSWDPEGSADGWCDRNLGWQCIGRVDYLRGTPYDVSRTFMYSGFDALNVSPNREVDDWTESAVAHLLVREILLVPGPAALPLLGAGLLMLGSLTRRRRYLPKRTGKDH